MTRGMPSTSWFPNNKARVTKTSMAGSTTKQHKGSFVDDDFGF
jgi:hypothetical protein